MTKTISKRNLLPVTRLRELLEYDKNTGVFKRRTAGRGGAKVGDLAGWNDGNGYLRVRVGGRKYKAHRLAWLYVTGRWPTGVLDHKNGNKIDNRFSNLREATYQLNAQNLQRAKRTNMIGILGVCKRDGAFRAAITHNRKQHYLGIFPTAEAAHIAYIKAKRKLHSGWFDSYR